MLEDMRQFLKKNLFTSTSPQTLLFRKRLMVGLAPILATYLVALCSLSWRSQLSFFHTKPSSSKPAKKVTRFFPAPDPLVFSKNIIVKAGSTITQTLQENRVGSIDRNNVVQELKKHINIRDIKTGTHFKINYKPGETTNEICLNYLSIKKGFAKEVRITRNKQGTFTAKTIVHPTDSRHQLVQGRIRTCFYQDARKQGLDTRMLHKVVQALGYKFDLQRDLHPGDQFRILFEKKVNKKTGAEKQEKCLLVEVILRGKKTRIYYFKRQRHVDVDFFDKKGQGLKSYFLRTPVDGARLSSGYGYRSHPILGYTKMHRGVDFAAPRGTPVMAAGNGTIVCMGRRGSYGNYMRIRHISGYSTAYAHLNGFKKGLRVGSRVKQGNVIAYVGATGRVTGAHLHFELLKSGRQINPKSVKMLPRVKLAGKDLQLFKAHTKKMDVLYKKSYADVS